MRHRALKRSIDFIRVHAGWTTQTHKHTQPYGRKYQRVTLRRRVLRVRAYVFIAFRRGNGIQLYQAFYLINPPENLMRPASLLHNTRHNTPKIK